LSKDDLLQIDGVITDVLAGGNYKVKLENEQEITAKLSGRMRKYYIRVILGDKVTIGLSPYDPTHGLIVRREKVARKPPGPSRR
jgi:translation initiation factor IF-1